MCLPRERVKNREGEVRAETRSLSRKSSVLFYYGNSKKVLRIVMDRIV